MNNSFLIAFESQSRLKEECKTKESYFYLEKLDYFIGFFLIRNENFDVLIQEKNYYLLSNFNENDLNIDFLDLIAIYDSNQKFEFNSAFMNIFCESYLCKNFPIK